MRIQITTLLLLTLFTAAAQTGYEKIDALYKSHQPKKVIEEGTAELNMLKNSDPDYKKIIRMRVDCYMELADFKSAIDDWKTLINFDSKDITFYEGLAYAYWANHDLTNCLASIDKAYKISPKDAGILSNMAYYYGEAGKYNESLKYAKTGLEQPKIDNETKALLLNNRGFAYLHLKQIDKGLIDINESISLNPNNSFAYCYRAMANIELNKMETVCKDLLKSKELGGEIMTRDLLSTYCDK